MSGAQGEIWIYWYWGPAVISGHIAIVKCNVLQCSGGASFSFTCSINHQACRSAFNTLAHEERTDTNAHIRTLTRAPSHTNTAFRVKAKAKE